MQDSYARIQQVFESNWERFITTLMIDGLKEKKERTFSYLIVKQVIIIGKKLKEIFSKNSVRKTDTEEPVAFDEVALEKTSVRDEEEQSGMHCLMVNTDSQ